MGPQVQPKCSWHPKHMRNNWELRKWGYLIRSGHTEALLLKKKKKDIKRPFFPPCTNWPIYGLRPSLLLDGYSKSLISSFEVSSVCLPLDCSHTLIHRWCCKLHPFLCPLLSLWETLEPVQCNEQHFGETIAASVPGLNCTNVFRALFLSPAITFILLGKYASAHILAVLNM